jgi:signal transduction histidine kinase
MLKFHQIILRKFVLIFSILFLIVGGIVYYWTKDFYITQTKNSLLENIDIVSFGFQEHCNMDTLAVKIKKDLNLRLTVIDANGVVIAESHRDKTTMDNHKYRAEVIQSNHEDYGLIIRHSNTIDKDLLYIAKKIPSENSFVYIRLAEELKTINEQMIQLGGKIFSALIIFFIVIFIMAYNTSKKIEDETLKIANFLTALAKKKKPTYIHSDFSKEFTQITSLLTKVSQILIKKEKQKSKFTSKLQASNQQKDDIISAISHEFKNPIAVINGYSQTLLDDENLNPNIRKKFISKIYKNGTKLNDLIDTLRLSIKLDGGQQATNFTQVNIASVVDDIVENMKINYPKREVIVKGDKTISVRADESLFSVLVTNLIENAIKYSEDEVIVNFDANSLSVVDTGIGISPKNLENITDKFYRVHENSWNNSLGLGLFIVKNIVNLHNFSIQIKSQENEGSTFTISF